MATGLPPPPGAVQTGSQVRGTPPQPASPSSSNARRSPPDPTITKPLAAVAWPKLSPTLAVHCGSHTSGLPGHDPGVASNDARTPAGERPSADRSLVTN